MKQIKKAIFPVGGLGTRFLPATKAMPKEMLPVVDKPLIQYAVEEAQAAGIEEFIFVTGRGKTAIEDHFDYSFEMTHFLEERGKKEELATLQSLALEPGQVSYIRQQEPLGLGHAVWCARRLVGNEPFAVVLADDFIYGDMPALKEMIDVYNQTSGSNVLAVMDVAKEHTSRYGIVTPVSDATAQSFEVKAVIEKPNPEVAPSNLAVIGRYLLNPEIFTVLENQFSGVGGEIQLTDAFAPLLTDQKFYGCRFSGKRFDCGSKSGYVSATLAVARDRPEIWDELPLEGAEKKAVGV